ncbi:MAG TPA: sugar phosphate isomerase/epimerase [Candidatus Acidoferrum sp.]|nr:sugar phosphate isomerase/epimerase [Candidatus Acidoferrum sp.]
MNRRTFIGTSIAATIATVYPDLGGAARPAWAADSAHQIDRIGLQLYTVRDLMKKDFEGTIAKVAATGYKEVEFAGYFHHSPKDIRAILDKNGLSAPSCHVDYKAVEKKWPETIEAAKIIGHSYIICPWIDEKQRKQPDGWKRAADLFNKAGEASQKAGIQLGYHNHSFEFQPADSLGGKLPYDFFLEALDPKLVTMEMDLCWISVAGKDPLDYFEKYPGRFPLVHVKDWVKDEKFSSSYKGAMGQAVKYGGHMADVGQGSVDWKRIFAQSNKAGIQHYFVENDEPKSAFDDIKISYDYLHNLTF